MPAGPYLRRLAGGSGRRLFRLGVAAAAELGGLVSSPPDSSRIRFSSSNCCCSCFLRSSSDSLPSVTRYWRRCRYAFLQESVRVVRLVQQPVLRQQPVADVDYIHAIDAVADVVVVDVAQRTQEPVADPARHRRERRRVRESES